MRAAKLGADAIWFDPRTSTTGEVKSSGLMIVGSGTLQNPEIDNKGTQRTVVLHLVAAKLFRQRDPDAIARRRAEYERVGTEAQGLRDRKKAGIDAVSEPARLRNALAGATPALATEILLETLPNAPLESVRMLLEHGADPNAYDGAVMLAALKRHDLMIVRLLLERGANPNVPKHALVGMALSPFSRELFDLLVSNGADLTGPIFPRLAAESGDVEVLKRVLGALRGKEKEQAASIALFYAAKKGHDGMVIVLVDGLKKSECQDALQNLASAGSVAGVQRLLARGVDVNETGEESTPLGAAASGGSPDMVRLLLAAGAKVNGAGRSGKTPLMQAANMDVAKILLDAGADVNAVCKVRGPAQRMTALDFAYERSKDGRESDVVELLRTRGAKRAADL